MRRGGLDLGNGLSGGGARSVFINHSPTRRIVSCSDLGHCSLEHAVEADAANRAGVGCRCNSDPDLCVATGRVGGAARIDAIPVDALTNRPSLSRVLVHREAADEPQCDLHASGSGDG
jgi:hypothetical protein